MPLSIPVNLNFDTVSYRIQGGNFTGAEVNVGKFEGSDLARDCRGAFVAEDNGVIFALGVNSPTNGEMTIFQFDLASATTIKGATYAGKTLDIVSVLSINNPRGFDVANSGKTIIVSNGSTDKKFYTITLTKAFDLSTAVDAGQVLDVSLLATPYTSRFNPDGTKFFWISPEQKLYEHMLSTAYDISTAGAGTLFNIPTEANPNAFDFNSDGTRMFIVGDTNDTIYQFTLTTPYDISTMSIDNGVEFAIGDQIASPESLQFINAGNKVTVVDRTDSSSDAKLKEFYTNSIYKET